MPELDVISKTRPSESIHTFRSAVTAADAAALTYTPHASKVTVPRGANGLVLFAGNFSATSKTITVYVVGWPGSGDDGISLGSATFNSDTFVKTVATPKYGASSAQTIDLRGCKYFYVFCSAITGSESVNITGWYI